MSKKIKKIPKNIILPSNNVDMEKFINDNKRELHRSIVDIVEYALDKKQVVIKLFEFENSPYAILIKHPDFRENLEHIFEVGMENEDYELCAKIKTLLERTEKPQYTKNYKKLNVL